MVAASTGPGPGGFARIDSDRGDGALCGAQRNYQRSTVGCEAGCVMQSAHLAGSPV